MASWEPKTVKEVVEGIGQEVYVLPVIQRNLVWGKEKMELLFDTLLKGNAFGGIMVLKEDSQQIPLFAHRLFSRNGEWHDSREPERLHQDKYLVIDGQQRLQSFYMGVKGSFNNSEVLYFNLNSSSEEYEFSFAESAAKLQARAANGDTEPELKIWYSVPALYSRLYMVQDDYQVSENIIVERGIVQEEQKSRIRRNTHRFYAMVMAANTIGISSVTINHAQVEAEKVRMVELFRRLNDGGTRLSALDLMASVFKGFDYRMEKFFREVVFEDMRLYQDEIIKFIFILQNQPLKEVTQVTQEDANFALDNQERITATLQGLQNFLRFAGMDNYYKERGRSVIPLYSIAYHIYFANAETEDLPALYDNYDINNQDFLRMKRWLYLSVLNGVFSRGSGWIPYKTGINKILRTLRSYQGKSFPTEALFDVYKRHPLRFSRSLAVDHLGDWDRDFVFYLMYDRRPEVGRDIDHVHPKSRLGKFRSEQVHSIANYQLLDIGTNRNEKRAKSLADWINGDVSAGARSDYLNRHLIPAKESLWQEKNFEQFITKRAQMIVEKVQEFVPAALPDATIPEPQPDTVPQNGRVDLLALSQLTPEQEGHPILQDKTLLYDIYRKQLNGHWSSRYRNELKRYNIRTIADFVRVIMALKLELWYDAGYAKVYRFHKPLADGQKAHFNRKSFGGWGWDLALKEMEERGFDWQSYVVS